MEKVRYFPEYSDMYRWLEETGYKMVDYSFTFSYGYRLIYLEV